LREKIHTLSKPDLVHLPVLLISICATIFTGKKENEQIIKKKSKSTGALNKDALII
jgi:hypothetical protein